MNWWQSADTEQSYYSVMQSDRNSFYGDVVSNSFNKPSYDEDNMLNQMYNSKYVHIIIIMILILFNIKRKCIINLQLH